MSRPLGRSAHPRSLARRLSLTLAVQTLIGLALVCTAVYAATAWSVGVRQKEELARHGEVVQHVLEEAVRDGDLEGLRHKLDDFMVGHSDVSLWLVARDGQAFYANPASAPLQSGSMHRIAIERAWDRVGSGGLRGEIAMDSSSDDALLRTLAMTLFACTVLGTAVVSSVGAWLVRRGLTPVTALSKQLRAISPHLLAQRLDGSMQPAELQPVVEQFNDLLARLELAYTQLKAFNADVAHELRTPLATLIGHSEVALRRERSAAEFKEIIGENLEDLQRLSMIVNDMLFLSKADRGETSRTSPVPSIAQIAREVIEFHDAVLQDSKLKAEVRGDAAGEFDAPLLRRALSNLMSNASRYAAPGSTVEIQIERCEPDRVRVCVNDVGTTIPSEHLPRLFDRFYRVDPARERRDANHGLGLAIVAAIARMHGGTAFAMSADGRTTVGLELPASHSEATAV